MACRGVCHDSNPVDVFITANPAMARDYLRRMYDCDLSPSDTNALWDLLDPQSAVNGLSWTTGNEDGMHVAFEIQAAEFAVVDMRGAL
jgi:hypothetical protein